MGVYQVDVLIQGFPGRAVCHGGLGWSTVTLIRGHGRIVLLDVGAFGMRKPLERRLKEYDVKPEDVTDVVLTHAHYDHIVNFTLFPRATIWIGDLEMNGAAAQDPGFNPIPELYVRELASSARVKRVLDRQEFLPGITAYAVPGHTPGHLLFVLDNGLVDILFSGDSAKNRAELLSRKVIDTDNMEESSNSISLIWNIWRAKKGSLLIPGHDLTMGLDETGQPYYIGERQAAISVWFSEKIEHSDRIDLSSV